MQIENRIDKLHANRDSPGKLPEVRASLGDNEIPGRGDISHPEQVPAVLRRNIPEAV